MSLRGGKEGELCCIIASVARKRPFYFAIQEINNEVENEMAFQTEYEAELN